ncbi:hypothetical protein T439DRAFT_189954 [Meredithblackwellia eburnea MCA 4105]
MPEDTDLDRLFTAVRFQDTLLILFCRAKLLAKGMTFDLIAGYRENVTALTVFEAAVLQAAPLLPAPLWNPRSHRLILQLFLLSISRKYCESAPFLRCKTLANEPDLELFTAREASWKNGTDLDTGDWMGAQHVLRLPVDFELEVLLRRKGCDHVIILPDTTNLLQRAFIYQSETAAHIDEPTNLPPPVSSLQTCINIKSRACISSLEDGPLLGDLGEAVCKSSTANSQASGTSIYNFSSPSEATPIRAELENSSSIDSNTSLSESRQSTITIKNLSPLASEEAVIGLLVANAGSVRGIKLSLPNWKEDTAEAIVLMDGDHDDAHGGVKNAVASLDGALFMGRIIEVSQTSHPLQDLPTPSRSLQYKPVSTLFPSHWESPAQREPPLLPTKLFLSGLPDLPFETLRLRILRFLWSFLEPDSILDVNLRSGQSSDSPFAFLEFDQRPDLDFVIKRVN